VRRRFNGTLISTFTQSDDIENNWQELQLFYKIVNQQKQYCKQEIHFIIFQSINKLSLIMLQLNYKAIPIQQHII
jgi:hypothetical protein